MASYQEDPGLQAVRQEVHRWDLQDLAVSVPSFEVPGVIVHLVVLDLPVEQDLSSQETLDHLDRVVLDPLVSFLVHEDLPPVESVVLVALLQLEAVVALVVVAVAVVLVALVVAVAVVPVALVAVAALVPVASAVADPEDQVAEVAVVVVHQVLAVVAVAQAA